MKNKYISRYGQFLVVFLFFLFWVNTAQGQSQVTYKKLMDFFGTLPAGAPCTSFDGTSGK